MTNPRSKGEAASAELDKKERQWRRNKDRIEAKRRRRAAIAGERRRAAYEKAHSSSSSLRRRLEG